MEVTNARPLQVPMVADEYPYSDGKPIAETPKHLDAIFFAMGTLRNWFADQPRVQVGANMFVYYQEGDKTKRLTPDLFVVRGLEALPERSYKLWETGRPPTFVLEVALPSTEQRDRGEKQALYASMGVAEYWRFNPTGFLNGPGLEGVRLAGGVLQGQGYKPLASVADGSIHSRVLGLDIRVDGRRGKTHLLRLRDPVTRRNLLTYRESEQGRREALLKLQRERFARRTAERHQDAAEQAQLEAELARGEADQARREEQRARLEAERARLEAERAQHETEREAARAKRDAEEEIARLRAQVAKLKGDQRNGLASKS